MAAVEDLIPAFAGALGRIHGERVRRLRPAAVARPPISSPLPIVAEPRPGIVYVDLARIEEDEFFGLVPRLAVARGVIFDLRQGSNPADTG